MANLPTNFVIPGPFVTINGTGTSTTTNGNVILFAASTALTAGSGVIVTFSYSNSTSFTPKAITLNAGGSGYAVNDSITVGQAGTITVTAVDAGGAITTFTSTLNTGTTTYDPSGTGVAGAGGSGTGATFDVTSNSITSYTADGFTVVNGGSGFHVGDQLTYHSGSIKVTSVDSNGAVVNGDIVITEPVTSQESNVSPLQITTVSGPVNELYYPADQADVNSTFGVTSDIARMYARYVANDSISPVYVLTSNSDSQADVVAALSTIISTEFSVIVSPFSDSLNVNAFDQFFDQRYSYAYEQYGIHLTAKTAGVADLIQYGTTVNSKYTSVAAFPEGSVDDDVVKAAAFASVVAPSIAADPAMPLQLLSLDVAVSSTTFSQSNRNALFNAGLAITKQNTAGEVILERSRTTYQTSADGVADDTYQDTETLPVITTVSQLVRTRLNTDFFEKRMKLAPDSTNVVGPNIATPAAIRSSVISEYQNCVGLGYVTDLDSFTKNLSVSILRVGVVGVVMNVTLIQQLRQIDITLNFTL